LHDIGKIGISDAILNKAGKLTDEEWEVMRRHPVIGKEIIKDIPFLQDAIPVVYAHHERWNGSGYPLGLHGKDIPLEARIFAVADIFDALTSVRPYRKQISNTEALGYLQEQAGILLDPDVVAAFARLLERGEI
jgi:HD-GYP domain-containing protein (c-di-GMP phosphodiesterase class II)